MKHLLPLALLIVSGCTIVRYYDTKKLRPQVQKLQTKSTSIMSVVEQDYRRKEQLMEAAKMQGVNFAVAPEQELAELFTKMTALRSELAERTATLQTATSELMAHIGDKRKIESTDPRFSEIEKFRGKSEDELDVINDGLKNYQTESNRFNDVAQRLRFSWVNVNQFKQQLVGVIGLLKLQCDSLDERLGQAKKSARSAQDRTELAAMGQDVKSLRGIAAELKEFLAKFEKATVGKSELIITPKHPQVELFNTLAPIQDRADQIIDSFNKKAKEYQAKT